MLYSSEFTIYMVFFYQVFISILIFNYANNVFNIK